MNHLKTELHTIQKGTDSIDKYLLRLKAIRDQLTAAGDSVSDNDIMIAALAGLPKEYSVIRTVILARESSITMKEFRAQLFGAEREIEGEMNVLSQNMSAMFIQGSSSSSNAASSSNSQNHSHIPASTGGIITAMPYGPSSQLQNSSTISQQFPQQFYPAPTKNPAPYFPSSTSFPSESYGFGFVGTSSNHNGSSSQSYMGTQLGSRPPNGNQYRGNGFRNNNNFRGKSFNSGGSFNYYSGGSRQNGNNTWSGNTNTRTNVTVECQICNKRGHTAPNCYSRYNANTSTAPPIPKCKICGKKGHIALPFQ